MCIYNFLYFFFLCFLLYSIISFLLYFLLLFVCSRLIFVNTYLLFTTAYVLYWVFTFIYDTLNFSVILLIHQFIQHTTINTRTSVITCLFQEYVCVLAWQTLWLHSSLSFLLFFSFRFYILFSKFIRARTVTLNEGMIMYLETTTPNRCLSNPRSMARIPTCTRITVFCLANGGVQR